MNDLKKYFKKNREIFDDKEPPEGHFERFEKRLDNFVAEKRHKRNLKIRIITAISIAASILLVVVVRTGLQTSSGNDIPPLAVSEFLETETFYKEQMDEQITAILCKLNNVDAETRNQLENDLQNIAEDNKNIVAEIRNIPDKELSIYYLVEHYNANMQTLQFINDKLSEYFKC